MPKILGGYYLKARQIQNSEIAHASPHIREIWDYLLREANHKDKKTNGKIIKRGQLLRTYNNIIDSLKWKVGWRTERYTKWQCENAMKFLRSRVMIATQKTTRGLVITVLNYNEYQDPKNYKSHTESHTESHSLPQSADTINKNEKNEKNEKKKNSRKIEFPKDFSLTEDLRKYAVDHEIDSSKVELFFESFENWAKAKNVKYIDWKRAFQNFVLKAPDYGKQFLKSEGRAW